MKTKFDLYLKKHVRKEEIEPIPKLIVYKVQPQTCYLPSYENYKINVDGQIIERMYYLEEETIKDTIIIKDMTLD